MSAKAPAPGVDSVVLAGGRVSGLFAWAAGTQVKALAPVGGVPMLRRVTEALLAATERVCVVGPEAVREASAPGCLWEPEGRSAPENALAGVRRLGAEAGSEGGERRVLLCAVDTPFLSPAALRDFLDRAPEADLCMPVVRKEDFIGMYPGGLGIYVRLIEGSYTGGCQWLLRPTPLLGSQELLARLHYARKSQLAMARTLGGAFVWKLVTRRLGLTDVEARLSELTGCACRAVADCAPELAFDVDTVFDLRDAERRLLSLA
jgi:molybdopterin-guanine dinucleotide biosynthesis protein A